MLMRRNYFNILVIVFLALAFYLQIQSKLTPNSVSASADLPSKIQSGVATLAFSPDGNTLASADKSGQITLWNVASGKQFSTLARQPGAVVTGLSFSPDGGTLASTAKDAITLWDVAGGQQRGILKNPTGAAVTGLSFSPDGGVLASVGSDAQMFLWNLASGASRRLPSSHQDSITALAFSPDGTLLASGGKDAYVRLWNVASGQERSALLNLSGAAVTGLTFSPDGQIVASAGEDAQITLWDTHSGAVQRTLVGHGDVIRGIAFSLDGKILASGGKDAHVKLWDVASGRERLTLLGPFGAAVTGVAFDSGGDTLASVGEDARILVWDVSTGQLRQVLAGHDKPVTDIAFLSDRALASASADGRFIVWDMATGIQRFAVQVPAPLSGSDGSALASADSTSAVSGKESRNAATSGTTASNRSPSGVDNPSATTMASAANRTVQASKPRVAAQTKGITALAVNSDGTRVGSVGNDGAVRIWDASLSELLALAGHSGPVVVGVAFGSGGKVASAGRDTEIRVWDATTGQQNRLLLAQEHPIRTLAASPDGKLLASAGEETRIMLWDAETGKLRSILNGHRDFINSVAFSADGQRLASAGVEGRILLWDVATGRILRTLIGHSDEINALTFSLDGKLLASAGQDQTVILWDATTGQRLQTLTGHQAPIRALAFSRNSKTLASAGQDFQILAWNTANGKPSKKIPTGAASFVNTLVFEPNGLLLVGDEGNEISEWNVETGTKEKAVKPTKPPKANQSSIQSIADSPERVVLVPHHGGPLAGSTIKGGASGANPSILERLLDWFVPAAHAAIPAPPGGPILVITSSSYDFRDYYAEILRTEGLNAFATADLSSITAATLVDYDVVILAPASLTTTQVTMLTDWVTAGGNLIAMRPDQQLAGLLGLTPMGTTLSEGYLLVDTSKAPGNGIVNQTIQFHGTADRYTLNGASSVATLYTSANTSTANPAVTLRSVGTNGGQAAAFAYDLATSIVYTRQGNPAWAAQERDGFSPIRSNDKFYGAASGDPKPDWVDLNKVAIPQADEQQRLLANLILEMNSDKKPLPRFWYFPNGKKAVVIMTGDDHANNGTAGRFDQFKAASPANCSVTNWECVRGTSYIFPNTPLTDPQAAAYNAEGFEVGLHLNTNCADFTQTQLEAFYSDQIAQFTSKYTSIPAPITQRHHCIAWSDWVTAAEVQFNHGIRLDTSYYFWPPSWVANVPGLFTGSAMPMRFAKLDGTLIDVYHAATQMTDESGQTYPYTIDTLLDRALGAEGYYGAYTINAHTDVAQIPESNAILASAPSRGVPIVSSKQMLDWLDGRNSSSFGAIAWSGNTLSFNVTPGVGANGLQALVPMTSSAGVLTGITYNASPITFTPDTIKGVQYASVSATAGTYVATYTADTTPPTVTAKSPVDGATAVSQGMTVTVTFSEAMDPSTITSSTFELRNASNTLTPATVTYNAGTRTATLTPSASLAGLTAYTAAVKSGASGVKDLAGNALAADVSWSFTTEVQPCASVPCSAWSSSTIPGTPSVNDPSAVELGVKFRTDLDGFITGVRFYQVNAGTYTGTLWSLGGQQLATGTVTATGSGWKQVTFSAPVAITSNTVYVASYHAPNGNYAATNSPAFSTAGVDSGPIHLLRDGVSGGNGTYAYSANSTFPTNTYNATNYWVDVVFATSTGPDTTPPTVTAQSPVPGATGVATGTVVTATFSEAMDAASITTSTFELRDATNALVPATVGYDAATKTATLAPTSALAANTVYTATIKGGATDPRVKDLAGNALGANVAWSFTTALADTTPPTVMAQSPIPGATGVATGMVVTATFSEAMDAASITTSTFELRDATDALVPATVGYDGASRTATLTPSGPLAPSATYTATLRGGTTDPRIKDLAGNALAVNLTWPFTTASTGTQACTETTSIWPTNPTPSTITDPDTSSIELGVKFRSTVNGFICGIRFYKGPNNTGAHTGSLWNSTGGPPLATVTFTNETASGWQQANFATPIAITANTVYVASYLAPVGRYSVNENYFTSGVASGPLYALSSTESGGNGVYLYGAGGFPTSSFNSSNYWVDVIFTTSIGPDTTPPTVITTSPASNVTGVNPASPVTATFSEALDPATITTSTFELRDPDNNNNLVPAAVSYAGNIATLTPSSALAASTVYTAILKGGTTDPRVKDSASNALAADFTWSFTTGVDPCAGGNPIVCENTKPGNPASEWDVSGAGDSSIQGFATDISVNRGETVRFKINTPATDYRLDIYRMGYYAGNGARKVATVQPSATLPQNQPNCLNDSGTGLIDCGNWAESASWTAPSDAVSGIYFAKAVREDGADAGKASHIVFIVRDDASTSDILFQTADTTWQAYNTYGGNSLYTGSPAGRAYKVSYNRPFNTRGVDNGQDWLFNTEYPMVRWLEANGYDVSYFTGVDSDRRGSLIQSHKLFLSVGHDEYWSGQQRANVEAARNAGKHLAFFSGNEVFWKIRWESSIDASGTPYRTLVCYKETHASAKIDPLSNVWTGTWRDPRFSPPADGGRPENALTGTLFTVNDGATTSIEVAAEDGKMRFWRNTSIANLAAGTKATLPFGTLGYEWDEDIDNGFRPAGLIRLSTTTVPNAPVLTDFGSTFGFGPATHALTLYKASSGAIVFGAGTVQWAWGLDSNHDRTVTPTDSSMQQATVNLFADMGTQPATLQSGLVAATASADSTAPTSTITTPTANSTVQPGSVVTITGTASDGGGGVVGGVEISVDGGTSWRRANGRASWTYAWTVPGAAGSVTIRSRAADDSGNLETPGTWITVTLPVAPTSIAVTPANPSISPGGTQQFTATGTYSDSSTQDLTSQVTWASSNTVVATISAGGIATGVAAGTTTISATLSGVSGSTSLTVAAPLSITTTSLAGGKIGVAYSATVAATGGATPYNWSVSAGTLPAGLTLNASTGAITGTPTASGTSSFTVQVTDAGGRTATRNLSIVIASLNSIAVTPANPTIQTGATQQFTATGTYSDGGTRNLTSSVVWASSNTSAVTLTTGGLATAITGSANISAMLFGVTGSTTLTVQSAPSAVADRFLFRANVLRTANVAGPLGLGVLANDTYAAAAPPLTAVAVTNPLPTGVTMDSTGVVTINRSNNTNFRYRASDGTLLSLPTTGALVNLTVNSAPTTAADDCTYVRVANGGNGSITAGTACVMTATPRTFTMNLISNDTDPNTTTNVPTDGVGDAVIGTIITASGTGVAVSASACQAAIIKTASRATITNNCDGTLTVTVAAAAPASPISLTYRALDDLGAQSGTRTDTVTVQ